LLKISGLWGSIQHLSKSPRWLKIQTTYAAALRIRLKFKNSACQKRLSGNNRMQRPSQMHRTLQTPGHPAPSSIILQVSNTSLEARAPGIQVMTPKGASMMCFMKCASTFVFEPTFTITLAISYSLTVPDWADTLRVLKDKDVCGLSDALIGESEWQRCLSWLWTTNTGVLEGGSGDESMCL